MKDGKTEFILMGTRAQLAKIKTDHIVVGGVNVKKSVISGILVCGLMIIFH